MLKYFIVCPLVFLAGFVDAVAGGGGLISLPAYLIAGVPVHSAIGTNKLSSAMGTTLTTVQYSRKGYISWKQSFYCIPLALFGSFLGARLALLISNQIFTVLMLIILPASAWYILKTKSLENRTSPSEKRPNPILIGSIAFALGIYDGFYGPGTGTFLILLLCGLAHLSLQKANGLTKVINLSTNLAALAVYLFSGNVIFPLGFSAGLFCLAGNYLGSRYFSKGNLKFVKPIILLVLAVFMIRVIVELFFS